MRFSHGLCRKRSVERLRVISVAVEIMSLALIKSSQATKRWNRSYSHGGYDRDQHKKSRHIVCQPGSGHVGGGRYMYMYTSLMISTYI